MEGFLKEITQKGLIRRTSVRPFGDLEPIPDSQEKDFFEETRLQDSEIDGERLFVLDVFISQMSEVSLSIM